MDVSDYYSEEEYQNIYNDLSGFEIWQENIQRCSVGVFHSLYPLLSSIIQFTLIQRLILSFDGYLSRRLQDLLIGLLGLFFLIIQGVNNISIISVLIYFTFSSIIIRVFRTYTYLGPFFIVFSLIATSACELLIGSSTFLGFRGSWMVMTMKMISLSFDIHDDEISEAGIMNFFGYVFNPSTYFFGLFTSYKRYKDASGFTLTLKDVRGLLLSGGYLTISCFSVLYGDCLIDLMPTHDISILDDFKNAQSFRFGHYFVNYFLWSTAVFGGFESAGFKVVDARKIELPRSMEEVVRFWNVPMHEFLHKYVYLKTKPVSPPIAVGLTFLTSALMHGFNFQISAVLISLAFFALSESLFRKRVAHRFDLCIKSRACQKCSHKNSKEIAWLINFVFVVFNVILLIYLGMPFDNSEAAETGYSMKHTLKHWFRWKFAGHGASAILLIFSFLI